MTILLSGAGRSSPAENGTMQRRKTICVLAWLAGVAFVLAFVAAAPVATAQTATRFVGTITAINGSTLTVKTDGDGERPVQVPATAPIKRIAPGQKDLSAAEPIQFGDLATGDRVLVKLDPQAQGDPPQALQVIAVKQTDVAAKQQKDREDWQRRGVGGLVKSVDAASGAILLSSGVGATAKTVTVHTTKATVLKRYAQASVSYDAVQIAAIDAIHVGDQLRARGQKNADGTEIDAEEVVSGTFRNISGTISTLDTAASTMVVKDLATKKQVTVHIAPDAQMKQLPETMARMLAARLKGGATAGQGSQVGAQAGAATGAPQAVAPQGGGQWGGQGGGMGRSGGMGGDPQQMLSRLPAIQLTDLKKGDAVMLVSTDGTTEVTGITLLAGVEPLLEAPAASQSLLNNWSLGSGSAEAAAQ